MAVEPVQLVLGLLAAAKGRTLETSTLAKAGDLFGFAPGTIRVTLTRLRQRGSIEALERGVYRLAARSAALQKEVAGWRNREDLLVDWSGGWIAVSTAGWSRSDRTATRRQTRILDRLGYATAAPGLEIRPDNRLGSIAQARDDLADQLPQAPVLLATDLPKRCVDAAVAKWNPRALERTYAGLIDELDRATAAVGDMPAGPAAATVFDVGDRAIRAIVADPLLPAALVDADQRGRLIQTMRDFDRLGRTLWNRVITEAIE